MVLNSVASVLSLNLVGITMLNIPICKSLFVSGLKYIHGHLNMSCFFYFHFFSSICDSFLMFELLKVLTLS